MHPVPASPVAQANRGSPGVAAAKFLRLLGRIAVVRRMNKQIRLMLLLPQRQFLLPGFEPAQVVGQLIAADKAHQRLVGGDQCMHRQLRFFLLRIAHGGGMGAA